MRLICEHSKTTVSTDDSMGSRQPRASHRSPGRTSRLPRGYRRELNLVPGAREHWETKIDRHIREREAQRISRLSALVRRIGSAA